MDHKQGILERFREMAGERLDDILHLVRQDRRELQIGEEPAHIRSVLRRTMREAGVNHSSEGKVLTQEEEFLLSAGEPDRAKQRESLGQILDCGAGALEKILAEPQPELSNAQRLGLECLLLLYVRPALLLAQGQMGRPSALWNLVEDQRENIETIQRGVGRLELLGHPELDWAGTAFLVNETTLMTTRHIAELFCENQGQAWAFRPGISPWMDYRCEGERLASASCRVRAVLGVHESYDLALLEVEPWPQAQPLVLSASPPEQLAGRPVYMIGYPARDSRRREPEVLSRIFRDVYGVKRVQPGQLRTTFKFAEVELMAHDCALLGQSGGACILDLETHQVVGMHLAGRFLENGTAIPLWALRQDPLLCKAGVSFARAEKNEVNRMVQQLERISRTRFWPDLCKSVNDLYQKACPRQ